MDERISILQDLFVEGFISEDELMARLGGAWSRSHNIASPDVSEITQWLETLESLLQRGMISTKSYASERGYVLEDLAPIMAMPDGQSPKDLTKVAVSAEPPPPQMKMAEKDMRKEPAPVPAPTPAQTMKVAATHNGAHVHLASYRSEKDAKRGWKNLQKRHQYLLGGLTSRVNEVDLGPGKGVYYRVEAGPLTDIKSAKDLCNKLKTRKLFCTVTA